MQDVSCNINVTRVPPSSDQIVIETILFLTLSLFTALTHQGAHEVPGAVLVPSMTDNALAKPDGSPRRRLS